MSTPEDSAVTSEQDTTAAELAAEETAGSTAEDPAAGAQPDDGSGSGGSPIRPDNVRTQP